MNINYLSDAIVLYAKDHGKNAAPLQDFIIKVDGDTATIDQWHVEGLNAPSLEALLPYIAQAENHFNATFYKKERQEKYPHIGDQLDAIWKGFNSMVEGGATLPTDTEDMRTNILAVKAAHPKP